MNRLIYLDNHATTRVDPRVLEAMLPYFAEHYGNAASRTHAFGWAAEEACERARQQIAALINGRPKEIVFTSGATESDNLAIKGVAAFYANRGDHIITAATEHKAVLDSCTALERAGRATVTRLPVDRHGRVDPDAVRRALTARTILISVMHANNEIGTLQPIAEIGRLAKERGILFHCDAAQSLGKVPIDVETMGIDLLSASAHKLHGPKGCGVLYVRARNPRVRLVAQLDGGGHERGLRSGTLNVAAAVGFGAACAIAQAAMAAEQARLLDLRERLWHGLQARVPDLTLNGHPTERLAGNLNVSFADVEGESLLVALRDIAVSSGSACTSATLEASYVLRAIGVPEHLAHGSVRFGLGRFNTAEEVDYVIERVAAEVERLRALSPRRAMARAR
jgi:cysteine desulfurase